MKYLFCLFALIVFSVSISAQNSKPNWFTDIDAAKEYAKKNEVDILMVFAGSDWCKPCIQFKNDILESPDFQIWSKDRLAILYLDFPAKKKNKLSKEQTTHNETLAERFNKSGLFPNILLLNSEEKVLANPTFKNQLLEDFVFELEPKLTAQK